MNIKNANGSRDVGRRDRMVEAVGNVFMTRPNFVAINVRRSCEGVPGDGDSGGEEMGAADSLPPCVVSSNPFAVPLPDDPSGTE